MFKPAELYIEKAAKIFVSLTVAAVFFCSGLMLCCRVFSFGSQAFTPKGASCCHPGKADHFKNPDSKSCHCCKIAKDSPDRGHGSFETAKSSDKLFAHKALGHDAYKLPRIELSLPASQGPPRAPAVALYIRLSNLRL